MLGKFISIAIVCTFFILPERLAQRVYAQDSGSYEYRDVERQKKAEEEEQQLRKLIGKRFWYLPHKNDTGQVRPTTDFFDEPDFLKRKFRLTRKDSFEVVDLVPNPEYQSTKYFKIRFDSGKEAYMWPFSVSVLTMMSGSCEDPLYDCFSKSDLSRIKQSANKAANNKFKKTNNNNVTANTAYYRTPKMSGIEKRVEYAFSLYQTMTSDDRIAAVKATGDNKTILYIQRIYMDKKIASAILISGVEANARKLGFTEIQFLDAMHNILSFRLR